MATLRFDFYSKSLDRLVPVTGIIPVKDGSRASHNGEAPFPALYLLHGYSGIDTDWLYGSDINALAMEHQIAVFCPSGENSFYLDDEVSGELYATLVGEELIEITRSLFPLSHKQEDTILGGFSMGGYGALRNGLFYDKTFGSIFAFSAADMIPNMQEVAAGKPDMVGKSIAYYERLFGMRLTDLPGSDRDLDALAKRYVEKNGKLPPIYCACGTEDRVVEACRRFNKMLAELPGNTVYEEWPGVHNWAFWNAALPKALAWWKAMRG